MGLVFFLGEGCVRDLKGIFMFKVKDGDVVGDC